MNITKSYSFSYGHMLPNQGGKCERPHGHNGVLEVWIYGDVIKTEGAPDEGMITDFGDLDKIVKPLVERFDHRFLVKGDEWIYDACLGFSLLRPEAFNDAFCVIGVRTTAENIATWFAETISNQLRIKKVYYDWVSCRFWETEKGSATCVV